ncbi:MAG: hypothetical protein OHK0046_35230 [Anaerolineae bacterium]
MGWVFLGALAIGVIALVLAATEDPDTLYRRTSGAGHIAANLMVAGFCLLVMIWSGYMFVTSYVKNRRVSIYGLTQSRLLILQPGAEQPLSYAKGAQINLQLHRAPAGDTLTVASGPFLMQLPPGQGEAVGHMIEKQLDIPVYGLANPAIKKERTTAPASYQGVDPNDPRYR